MNKTERFDIQIECELSDEYFLDWNDLSPEVKAFWNQTDKQPGCEGTGYISVINCEGCPFCKRFEVEPA